MTPAQRDAILAAHWSERAKLPWFNESSTSPDLLHPSSNDVARVTGQAVSAIPGLPPEFGDYFRGSVAWHEGRMEEARSNWVALLTRPASQRRFKSTWAAYMLARSWEETDAAKANHWFQEVRRLATNGFADSLGLAAASFGGEARLRWREGHYAQSINLYLDQDAAGDTTGRGLAAARRRASAGDGKCSPRADRQGRARAEGHYRLSHFGFRSANGQCGQHAQKGEP